MKEYTIDIRSGFSAMIFLATIFQLVCGFSGFWSFSYYWIGILCFIVGGCSEARCVNMDLVEYWLWLASCWLLCILMPIHSESLRILIFNALGSGCIGQACFLVASLVGNWNVFAVFFWKKQCLLVFLDLICVGTEKLCSTCDCTHIGCFLYN